MRQVQLLDDQSDLATYAAEAEAGGTVTLLRDNKPIAQIIPFPQPSVSEAECDAAWARIQALMKKGIPMGGFRIENRDEIYDRD